MWCGLCLMECWTRFCHLIYLCGFWNKLMSWLLIGMLGKRHVEWDIINTYFEHRWRCNYSEKQLSFIIISGDDCNVKLLVNVICSPHFTVLQIWNGQVLQYVWSHHRQVIYHVSIYLLYSIWLDPNLNRWIFHLWLELRI